MDRELKARVTDLDTTREQLAKAGATVLGVDEYYYIYFNQPGGDVLKLSIHDQEVNRVRMKAEGILFAITSKEPVASLSDELESLGRQYGERRRIRNRRTRYLVNDSTVSINEIEDVGVFIVISSENPSFDLLKDLTPNGAPEIITESFDHL